MPGKFFQNFDFLIFLPVLVLAGFSLTIIWSVKPGLVSSQLAFFLLGFILFFLLAQLDWQILANFWWVFYPLSILLLLLTFFGPETRGAIRWLEIGNFRFQPSEIVKPFLIIFLSGFFVKKTAGNWRYALFGLVIWMMPLFLVFRQPDLGNTLVFGAIFLAVVFVAGLRPILGVLGGLGIAVVTPLVWLFLAPYQKQRIFSFLNPQLDPQGTGYNLLQSVITVGSGGIFGRGLGQGTQAHLLFLPERHTDFIFASLSEELGFVGALLLILAYVLLLWRILAAAKNTEESFGVLVAVGIFTMIFTQVSINIGMNLGIMPITGVTLPLVSYGGSSVVATMITLGIVVSIAKAGKREKFLEIK